MRKYTFTFLSLALTILVSAFMREQAFAQAEVAALEAAPTVSVQSVNPNGIVVDDDGRCPGTDFTSIQAAVNAAPAGSVIQVCPGTYNQQVVINKPLTVRGVSFENENAAIIRPSPAVANTTSLFDGSPIAAIILVRRAGNVTLENLTVDGSANGISGCGTGLVGVFYRNASGVANAVTAKNLQYGSGLETCPSGIGVFAQSGAEQGVTPGARLTVANSSIHAYQRAGIIGNEQGTVLTAIGNAITGLGPTPNLPQSGVQIGFGATGQVVGNTIINHIYTPCNAQGNCPQVSTSVLAIEADNVKVLGNTVGRSQINIFQAGNGAEIAGNTILGSNILYGVQLAGNNNVVKLNRIFNSEEAGVFVLSGDNNKVNSNLINDAEFGVFILEATNTVTTGNTILNTLTQIFIEEEEEAAAASAVQKAKASPSLGLTSAARP
jgi:hypothetical protein